MVRAAVFAGSLRMWPPETRRRKPQKKLDKSCTIEYTNTTEKKFY